MRIVYLMPGAGGSFYCENCLRDAALIRAVAALGHDPLMVPLYLPLQIDEPTTVPAAPVFFGGINVYLEQKSALFRRLPRWLTAWLDAPWLLRLAAKRAGMTRARDLADTTLSMLRGEDGNQVRELDRLTDWLAAEQRPDVVCLSNCLLIGIARRVRDRLRVPVACALQDEDIFLDDLPEPGRTQAYEAIAERAQHVDAFLAVSHFYAGLMRERLRLPDDKLHVVHSGIPLEGYEPASAPADPPVIGFLERLCPEKGLDTLVDAFLLLRGTHKGLRLRLAGGWTAADEPFLRRVRRRLAGRGAENEVELLPNLQREDRQAFLRSLSVLSVPARHAEAFGMYILEALATGVPVALPRRGAFSELIEATGGGILYDGDGPEPLAAALGGLLADPARARGLGARGREAVRRDFCVEVTARKTIEVYASLLPKAPIPSGG